jgi:hypothetical protein
MLKAGPMLALALSSPLTRRRSFRARLGALRSLAVAASLLAPLAGAGTARAQQQEPVPDVPRPATTVGPRRGDYLFPEAGHFSASLGSGFPFLGVGEVAYGFARGFSAGALAAATPDMATLPGTTAFGTRLRGVLWRREGWRAALVAPVLYYPSVPGFGGGRDPWVLTRPEVVLERRFDSGMTANVGLGVIAAACTESLLTLGREHSADAMTGVWETARIGGSLPTSRTTSLFGEASLVMDGLRPAARWIGIVPVVTIVGIAANL